MFRLTSCNTASTQRSSTTTGAWSESRGRSFADLGTPARVVGTPLISFGYWTLIAGGLLGERNARSSLKALSALYHHVGGGRSLGYRLCHKSIQPSQRRTKYSRRTRRVGPHTGLPQYEGPNARSCNLRQSTRSRTTNTVIPTKVPEFGGADYPSMKAQALPANSLSMLDQSAIDGPWRRESFSATSRTPVTAIPASLANASPT